ncbi:MAG: thiamine phosphate synthase [Chloroflexota bacterium]|nr:thiamine phosphate synthase [Chloroflexota bacterium]MDE2942239.1 thiamine phosphate synthase [Chloroflexota bacterium]MDE3267706.1 thiamine phosphate synthase [Chloroflexota bacterium]
MLCLVTDRHLCGAEALEATVDAAVSGGVDLVQLREKDLPAGELLRLARSLRRITRGRAALVINDRLDVALAAEADGLHLPEASISVADARAVAPSHLMISKAVHDAAGASEADAEGADMLVLGTVFDTASKPGAESGGLALVREATRGVRAPVLAIGGIGPANAGSVIEAGASGVAVISAIMSAADPESAARELKQVMLAAWNSRERVGAGA